MYLEIFLADFAVFRVFWGILRKYLNFPGPRPRKISEALTEGVICGLQVRIWSIKYVQTVNAKLTLRKETWLFCRLMF